MASRESTQAVIAELKTALDDANSDYVKWLKRENTELRQNCIVAKQMAEANENLRGEATRHTEAGKGMVTGMGRSDRLGVTVPETDFGEN